MKSRSAAKLDDLRPPLEGLPVRVTKIVFLLHQTAVRMKNSRMVPILVLLVISLHLSCSSGVRCGTRTTAHGIILESLRLTHNGLLLQIACNGNGTCITVIYITLGITVVERL